MGLSLPIAIRYSVRGARGEVMDLVTDTQKFVLVGSMVYRDVMVSEASLVIERVQSPPAS